MQSKIVSLIIILLTVAFFGVTMSGCSFVESETPDFEIETPSVPLSKPVQMSRIDPLSQIDPSFVIPVPDAPGLLTESNDQAFIDHSNKHNGYITVGFHGNTDKALRVLILAPCSTEYVYNLKSGSSEVYPLTSGDGLYTISVHEHYDENVYKDILKVTINVKLVSGFAPFISPNYYVNYCKDDPITAKAIELRTESNNFINTVEAIYNFIAMNIAYDFELAKTIKNGYAPDPNSVLERGSGICLDIATLTTAMLRSQGIPAKLVIGNYYDPDSGIIYHAWVSVYSEVDCKIGDHTYFTGGTWNVLDPTIASMLGTSASGINNATLSADNGSLYTPMYYY